MKVIKQIKIRIGEPLTAVALSSKGVLFGSISGYLGYFPKDSQKVFYVKEVFDELIRCITFQDDTTAYVGVGDVSGLIVHLNDPEKIEYDTIEYDKRNHISSQCASTMPFLYKHICILVPFPSTNAKETQIELHGSRQPSWLINYQNGTMTELGAINVGSQSVPFYFDGKKLVWLEFLEQKLKTLMNYDLRSQKIEKIIDYPYASGIYFISHVKLYKDKLIMVQNHKKVVIYDLVKKESTLLYEHKSQIVALAFYVNKQKGDKSELPIQDKDVSIEIRNPEEESKEPQEKTTISSSNIKIVTVDHSENLFFYEGHSLVKAMKIKSLPGFPDMPKNNYLFDMGYPYYMAMDSTHIAFTSDLGLFVLQYN